MANSDSQFVELLRRHQNDLLHFILPLVGNLDDAREVLQETAIALWQKFSQCDADRPFVPWAKQFARYEVLMFHRQRRGFNFFTGELIDQLAERQEMLSAFEEAWRVALEECLGELQTEDRRLLDRRYSERGATIHELAHEIGQTPNVLYKAMGRIREALVRCIMRKLPADSTQLRPQRTMNSSSRRELGTLLATICDVGDLNDEDQDRVRELLRTADAREMYLDWMSLHADLVLRDDSAATEAAGLFTKTEQGYKAIVEDSCLHEFDWLHVEQFDDVAIVHLMEPLLKRDSRLDPRQELLEFLKKTRTTKVVISLRSVTYLTSNTLNFLLRARDHFTTRDGEIRLANVSEDIREVLALLNLDGGYAFKIHDSTAAALKALRSD